MGKKRITGVTTRSGDQGKSRLATGRLVQKSSHSIRCLGGLDELNSSLGIAVSYITDQNVLKTIAEIQQTLFDAGAMIALEGESEPIKIENLEDQIELENEALPPLQEFVIPGGNHACAHLHLSRAICRRVEIDLWDLEKENPNYQTLAVYLNRLSDYLFIAARKISDDEPQWRGPKKY